MQKALKIVVNGKDYYHEFDETTGFYGKRIYTKEELIEQILKEIVVTEIEVNHKEMDEVLRMVPNVEHRERIQRYISYLEGVVESLE